MADIAKLESRPSILHIFKLRRGRNRFDLADWLTYGFLLLGFVIFFLPVVWVVLSSFKTSANLQEFPPTILPYATQTAEVQGFDTPLTLFDVVMEDGTTERVALIRRVGKIAQMIDPEDPSAGRLQIAADALAPVKSLHFAVENYTNLLSGSENQIGRYVYNSLFITIVATVITVIINSMAAFALSKYRFRGSGIALFGILSMLMIPASVILVPIYLIVAEMGLIANPWGVILPTVATPTGVFLLRQYMLTIPDELLEAARMDHASEWRIFWRIILPLSTPALAVVAIFSILSRWNDFLLPLLILNKREAYTLQLALTSFQTQYGIRYDMLLAMTTITALPLALVFIFLQRYITTGIASTGIK
ncbi:carbohydrate ABC transporter permease [Falsirhodobacter deserti]|uniref:carbohydrate ABC transporter permease n=1 Tax=Falsirhodobacter deserti TaxID=1365611 RepID=UPI000FE3B31E|nr:carbohydrate ABC transporter permease [Falsirhodobacter deserti]